MKVTTFLCLTGIVIGGLFIYNKLYPSQSSLQTKKVDDINAIEARSIFDFTALDIDDNRVNLSKYKGFVTYIVNVASE